jgi:hypothetical protein
MTAGKFHGVAAKLAPEYDRHLMGGVATCFPADGGQDLFVFGVVCEGVEVEIDWRILA